MAVVMWLESVGVDIAQLMADVQSSGIGLALIRAAIGIGTKLGGIGTESWPQRRQLPA